MRKAVWATDYDYRTDTCFQRPCCPECKDPIFLRNGGKYKCINCGKVVVPDSKMIKWMEERSETKVEIEDCPDFSVEHEGKKIKMGCGGKACVEAHYIRNEVTMEWQYAWSICRQCGMRTIV